MSKVLVLGAGRVVGPCLRQLAKRKELSICVAAIEFVGDIDKVISEIPQASKLVLDAAKDDAELEKRVMEHDLVISLLPYLLHPKVAKLCIKHKKLMVTASYVSPALKEMDDDAKAAGIIIMNEVGLDPGIDHLIASKHIHDLRSKGGKMLAFESWCGGLPAPECADNPVGYKLSWSPYGVLLALRNPCKFRRDGKIVEHPAAKVLGTRKDMELMISLLVEGYANRDSVPFAKDYGIDDIPTIIRGTLRYRGFSDIFQFMMDEGYLDLEKIPAEKKTWLEVSTGIFKCDAADLKNVAVKKCGSAKTVRAMEWLGVFEDAPLPDAEDRSYLNLLSVLMEKKMSYKAGERDAVFMQNIFDVEFPDKTKMRRKVTMIEYGNDENTAMATTVGVPCAIAALMVLDGKIKTKGVLAPHSIEIAEPIFDELMVNSGLHISVAEEPLE